MNDAGAGLPEADAVFRGARFEEIQDFSIFLVGFFEIGGSADAGLNQVIAVNRARHRHLRASREHELQNGHLGRGILHRDAIGRQADMAFSPFQGLPRHRP